MFCKMRHFFTFVTADSTFNKAVTPRQPPQTDSVLFSVCKTICYRVRSADERGALTKHTVFSPSCRCGDSEADVLHLFKSENALQCCFFAACLLKLTRDTHAAVRAINHTAPVSQLFLPSHPDVCRSHRSHLLNIFTAIPLQQCLSFVALMLKHTKQVVFNDSLCRC